MIPILVEQVIAEFLKIRRNLTLQFLHVYYNVQHLKQTYNIMSWTEIQKQYSCMTIDNVGLFYYLKNVLGKG